MSPRLTVKTVLANPKRKTKLKRKKPMRRRGAPKRAARSLSGDWVLRVVTTGRKFLWWNGRAWGPSKAKAKKYGSSTPASIDLARLRKPSGWIAADVMPA